MARMIREYHFTRLEAWEDLPLAQAFAYEAAAIMANPWLSVELARDGYIAQERFKHV